MISFWRGNGRLLSTVSLNDPEERDKHVKPIADKSQNRPTGPGLTELTAHWVVYDVGWAQFNFNTTYCSRFMPV